MQNGENPAGIPDKLLKPYDPAGEEPAIYAAWEQSGYFNPDQMIADGIAAADAEPFTVVLPPPNVTGVLHLGHAYEDSLQDAIIRYQRMCGKLALWIPGTDSAAIATQARVEKAIQKEEGKSRHDLGRDELVRRVSEYAQQSEHTILSQVRKMGSSLDWSRYAYTLDAPRTKAVSEAFKRMYDAGLIYRGHRIVNWDPKGQTTISDDEIMHEARKATLYTFKYAKDFPIAISTTRPETKVGDVAVAVHPDDERYTSFIGKEYDAEFCGVPIHIKIIADETVEKEFGTGALGVTPAHSLIDWEIADRHDLPRPQIIDEYAKLMVGDERLKGKKTMEAREVVVQWLRDEGLLEKEEDVDQNISVAERTGGIIEPLPKLQWFIGVNTEFVMQHSEIPGIADGSTVTLKTLMRAAVEHGGVQMPQENFRKIYFHWIDNLRDWCISRQIWFGHRIPIWYNGDEIRCQEETPGEGWVRDPDVLDTWFSSALWTFSTLGWPEQTSDLARFHPTAFMSPAYEILPLWVSRMILMSGFHLGQVPFRTVLIHGLVRDKQGRKFSKSLNNGVDPVEMIEKYGADALRMGLLVGTAIGNDIRFEEQKVKGYKHFANKLWNITRFVLTNYSPSDAAYTDADQALMEEWNQLAAKVTADIDAYRLHIASESIYQYIWTRFADEILEQSKPILNGDDAAAKASRQRLLLEILAGNCKLLHPFMPFVTESIWQLLPLTDKKQFILTETWPRQ